MNFTIERIKSLKDAFGSDGVVIAGGTNLVDLMKENIVRPSLLIDVTKLPLKEISVSEKGASLGALSTNADVAHHKTIEKYYPLLSESILAGASPQIRNMATTGGNLLQRTRCYYFYDTALPCNKREPGSGCGALTGINRMHAILGASMECVAVHPSDMCVGLRALDAQVHVEGSEGQRIIPFKDFHRLPEERPEFDNTLKVGELITKITLPPSRFRQHYSYIKIRDRSSYAFALISVAAGLEIMNNKIVSCALALGGVAHKPWRDEKVEMNLTGRSPNKKTFEEFAEALLADAQGLEHNAFKIPLAHKVIIRALTEASERKSL